MATGGIDLGAPILDFEDNNGVLITDGIVTGAGFERRVITRTETN